MIYYVYAKMYFNRTQKTYITGSEEGVKNDMDRLYNNGSGLAFKIQCTALVQVSAQRHSPRGFKRAD